MMLVRAVLGACLLVAVIIGMAYAGRHGDVLLGTAIVAFLLLLGFLNVALLIRRSRR